MCFTHLIIMYYIHLTYICTYMYVYVQVQISYHVLSYPSLLFASCLANIHLLMYLLVNQIRKMSHTFWGNVPCLVKLPFSFFFGRKKWE